LQVCEALAAKNIPLPYIVFVTAYDEYALKAFEVHALDYLLKPFDRERFGKCLNHVLNQLRDRPKESPDPRLLSFFEELRQRTQAPERLIFKQNGRILFVRLETIDWVESDGNYIKIHAGPETHHLRETLGDIEAQLPARSFMRISRSAIVNLNRIKELQPLFYGDYVVILHNGSKLNLSRGYRDRLEALLGGKGDAP
jgi:two-component system LytT family response regulator